MKLLLLAGAALLFLFRGRAQAPTRTPWTNAGLPPPVGTPAELRTLATELATALRARAASVPGLVRQFQRRAGLTVIARELTPEQVAETLEIERRVSAERWSEGGLTSSVQTTPGFTAPPTTSGVYDALTRQALGWYGGMAQEETP